ncbi:unnamed protein product [Urochloa humidicola]
MDGCRLFWHRLRKELSHPQVFNQISMNEQEEEYDGPPPKEIPALIVSTIGGKKMEKGDVFLIFPVN